MKNKLYAALVFVIVLLAPALVRADDIDDALTLPPDNSTVDFLDCGHSGYGGIDVANISWLERNLCDDLRWADIDISDYADQAGDLYDETVSQRETIKALTLEIRRYQRLGRTESYLKKQLTKIKKRR